MPRWLQGMILLPFHLWVWYRTKNKQRNNRRKPIEQCEPSDFILGVGPIKKE